MDAELLKTLGIGGSGVGIVAVILWRFYVTFKQQQREDNKGETLDARVDKFTSNLQGTIEKLSVTLSGLQKEQNEMVRKLAIAEADLIIARGQIELFKNQEDKSSTRIRYLEGLLREKGVAYV